LKVRVLRGANFCSWRQRIRTKRKGGKKGGVYGEKIQAGSPKSINCILNPPLILLPTITMGDRKRG